MKGTVKRSQIVLSIKEKSRSIFSSWVTRGMGEQNETEGSPKMLLPWRRHRTQGSHTGEERSTKSLTI